MESEQKSEDDVDLEIYKKPLKNWIASLEKKSDGSQKSKSHLLTLKRVYTLCQSGSIQTPEVRKKVMQVLKNTFLQKVKGAKISGKDTESSSADKACSESPSKPYIQEDQCSSDLSSALQNVGSSSPNVEDICAPASSKHEKNLGSSSPKDYECSESLSKSNIKADQSSSALANALENVGSSSSSNVETACSLSSSKHEQNLGPLPEHVGSLGSSTVSEPKISLVSSFSSKIDENSAALSSPSASSEPKSNSVSSSSSNIDENSSSSSLSNLEVVTPVTLPSSMVQIALNPSPFSKLERNLGAPLSSIVEKKQYSSYSEEHPASSMLEGNHAVSLSKAKRNVVPSSPSTSVKSDPIVSSSSKLDEVQILSVDISSNRSSDELSAVPKEKYPLVKSSSKFDEVQILSVGIGSNRSSDELSAIPKEKYPLVKSSASDEVQILAVGISSNQPSNEFPAVPTEKYPLVKSETPNETSSQNNSMISSARPPGCEPPKSTDVQPVMKDVSRSSSAVVAVSQTAMKHEAQGDPIDVEELPLIIDVESDSGAERPSRNASITIANDSSEHDEESLSKNAEHLARVKISTVDSENLQENTSNRGNSSLERNSNNIDRKRKLPHSHMFDNESGNSNRR